MYLNNVDSSLVFFFTFESTKTTSSIKIMLNTRTKKQIQASKEALFAMQMELLRNPSAKTSTLASQGKAEVSNALESPYCDPTTGELMLSSHIVVNAGGFRNGNIVGLSFQSSTIEEKGYQSLPNIALSNTLHEWPHLITSLSTKIRNFITRKREYTFASSLDCEQKLAKSIRIMFDLIVASDQIVCEEDSDEVVDPDDVNFTIPRDFEDVINASDYIHRPEVIVNEGSGHSYGQKSLDKWLKRHTRAPNTNKEIIGVVRRVPNRNLSVAMSICRDVGSACASLDDVITEERFDSASLTVLLDSIVVLQKSIQAVYRMTNKHSKKSEPAIFFVSFYLSYIFVQTSVSSKIVNDIITMFCGGFPGLVYTPLPHRLTPRYVLCVISDSLQHMYVTATTMAMLFGTSSSVGVGGVGGGECCSVGVGGGGGGDSSVGGYNKFSLEETTQSVVTLCTKASVVMCTLSSVLFLSHMEGTQESPEIEEQCRHILSVCEEANRSITPKSVLHAVSVAVLEGSVIAKYLSSEVATPSVVEKVATVVWRVSKLFLTFSESILTTPTTTSTPSVNNIIHVDPLIQDIFRSNRQHFKCIFENMVVVGKKYVNSDVGKSFPNPSLSILESFINFDDCMSIYSTETLEKKLKLFIPVVEWQAHFIANRIRSPVDYLHTHVCSQWSTHPLSKDDPKYETRDGMITIATPGTVVMCTLNNR